jgi:hypothetical protein
VEVWQLVEVMALTPVEAWQLVEVMALTPVEVWQLVEAWQLVEVMALTPVEFCASESSVWSVVWVVPLERLCCAQVVPPDHASHQTTRACEVIRVLHEYVLGTPA